MTKKCLRRNKYVFGKTPTADLSLYDRSASDAYDYVLCKIKVSQVQNTNRGHSVDGHPFSLGLSGLVYDLRMILPFSLASF